MSKFVSTTEMNERGGGKFFHCCFVFNYFVSVEAEVIKMFLPLKAGCGARQRKSDPLPSLCGGSIQAEHF